MVHVFISSSVRTDNFALPTVNCLYSGFTIRTVGTDGQGFQGLPHALAITLTTCFAKRFYTFTDGVFISPSVRTDNLAFSCLWTKANYLFHQTILHIHRWCIHLFIGTSGQRRFTDGRLPRFSSAISCPWNNANSSITLNVRHLNKNKS